MAALDEIETLEKKIHDALNRIDELKAKHEKSDDNAQKLRGAIEAAQAKVTLHGNNRLHAKNAATKDVDWKLYKMTLKHLESAKLTVEESKALLAGAMSAMTACNEETDFLNGRIAKWRAALAEYGQLIEVNFRRAA